MIRKMIYEVREFAAQMKKQNISAHAGSTAFFVFVSLLPMLIMICTIIPFTPLTEANLEQAILEVTPNVIDPLAESLVKEVYEKSAGILSLAAVTTLWSAGKGVLSLMRGLNDINDVEENRNYFVVRAVSSVYTLILLLMVILSLLVMVFGNEVVGVLFRRIPKLKVLVSLMMPFRFVVVWAVLTVFFAVIYTYIPNRKLKLKEQLCGAVFTAVVWSGLSWGFSIYVDRGVTEGIYGNLSVLIIVMLWLYFCMYIIFVGAYINKYVQRLQMRRENGA